MGADKEWFEIIMKQANGSLMTALENQIQADIGGTIEKANRVANHILDILDIANENKEQEIRNKAIDEFVERLKKHEQENWIDHQEYGITWEDIEQIAEELKESNNE